MLTAIPQYIPQEQLNQLTRLATNSERLRHTWVVSKPEDDFQILINAMQVGSVVRPHRHPISRPAAFQESIRLLQGEIAILTFDDLGKRLSQHHLKGQQNQPVLIPCDVFHTVVALAPDTVFIEYKPLRYAPKNDKQFLASA